MATRREWQPAWFPREFITLSVEVLTATLLSLLVLYTTAISLVMLIPPILFLVLIRTVLPAVVGWRALSTSSWHGLEIVLWCLIAGGSSCRVCPTCGR